MINLKFKLSKYKLIKILIVLYIILFVFLYLIEFYKEPKISSISQINNKNIGKTIRVYSNILEITSIKDKNIFILTLNDKQLNITKTGIIFQNITSTDLINSKNLNKKYLITGRISKYKNRVEIIIKKITKS